MNLVPDSVPKAHFITLLCTGFIKRHVSWQLVSNSICTEMGGNGNMTFMLKN